MSFERKPMVDDLLASTWSCEPYTDDEKARLRSFEAMAWALDPEVVAEEGRWANFRASARQDLAALEAEE